MSEPNTDESDVLSYRVGQLEKTVATGFRELKAELLELKAHYATKSDLLEQDQRNSVEHRRIDNEISGVKEDVAKIQDYIDWGVRIIIGAVIVSVLALVGLSQ